MDQATTFHQRRFCAQWEVVLHKARKRHSLQPNEPEINLKMRLALW